MEFDVIWLDVNPYLAKQEQPVYWLERPLPESAQGDAKGNLFNKAEIARLGTWWVPGSDLNAETTEWSLTKSGQYVRIPVQAYRTKLRSLAAVWGTGIQLGMRATTTLREQTIQPIERCLLVLGHEGHDLTNAYRCYVGMAFKVKEN